MSAGSLKWPNVYPVSGFRLGTAKAGIRVSGRRDLVVMGWSEGSSVSGVFTRNLFRAAPVQLCMERLSGNPSYFLINTGYANAGTGTAGLEAAKKTSAELARLVGVEEHQVLPFSTGVIGEPLPIDKICAAQPEAINSLSETGWSQAAEGIMTTDTRPKTSSRKFECNGKTFTVTGISKGSGMIKPDMATMLAFMATDVAVDRTFLQRLLREVADKTFNRITIDGDTSTNDSFMMVATGAKGNDPIRTNAGELAEKLNDTVHSVAMELSKSIVRDGEGASKFVTVRVEQASTSRDALRVAYTVAHSPLVKTALFACDPNWGRILAAIGRSKVANMDIDQVSIWLGDVPIVTCGEPATGYTESDGIRVMNDHDIVIRIALGQGMCQEEIWTTDLSYDYVKINAEYRS